MQQEMRGSTAEGVLRSPPRDAGAGRLAKRDASRESLLNTTGSADSGSLAGAGSEEEREFECSSVSSQDSMLDFGPFRGLEGPKRLQSSGCSAVGRACTGFTSATPQVQRPCC